MDSNVFKASIQKIKEASINNKLVIFVGTGVSKNSGLPDWYELIDILKKELPEKVTEKEKDFLKLAQIYKNLRGQKEYLDKIRSIFFNGNYFFNPINEAIFDLKPSHIITTNYDNLLEQVNYKYNSIFTKIVKDKDFPYSNNDKFIIKMHGDLDEGNIVLTEDDYLNYPMNFPLVETYIKSLLSTKLFLFIGFSFNDINLKFITNNILNLLKADCQPMYLLSVDDLDSIQHDYLRNRGIRVVEYNRVIDASILKKLPRELTKKLSHSKGQKLYAFLKYIDDFDIFQENNKNKNIIDYLYNIITTQFNELRIIGGKNFVKFYPFNKSDKNNRSHYFYFDFLSDNPDLLNINNSLKNNFKNKREFLIKYKKQYDEIITFAKHNGIDKFNGQKLSIIKRNTEKSGLDYYYMLDFKSLLSHIQILKTKHSYEVSINDFELPFLYYKTFQYYEAFLKFKELSQKCLEQKKYILYFICQYNRDSLRKLVFNEVLSGDNKLKFETIDSLDKEFEKELNLIYNNQNDYFSSIPVKDKELKAIIKTIYNYTYVYSLLHNVNKIANEIYDSKRIASNGGVSINSRIENITDEVFSLWNLCNNNYLISENYSEHKFIYQKAFEAFVISNTIPENTDPRRQSSKIKELYPFNIIVTLFNVDYKEIIEIFDKNEIKTFNFSNDHVNEIIKWRDNLLASFPIITNNYLLRKHLFDVLSSYLVIISKMKLQQPFYFKIIELLISSKIDLLEIEGALVYLIKSENFIFSEYDLYKLLNYYILNDNNNDFSYTLCMTVLDRVRNKEQFAKYDNEEVILKLINEPNKDTLFPRSILISFASISNENCKKLIINKIDKILLKNFNENMYRLCIDCKLNLAQNYDSVYLSIIESQLSTNHSQFFYHIRSIYRIYKTTSSPEIKSQIKKLTSKYPYLHFLISPKSVNNFQDFSAKWLTFLWEEELIHISKNKELKSRIIQLIKESPHKKWLFDILVTYFNN